MVMQPTRCLLIYATTRSPMQVCQAHERIEMMATDRPWCLWVLGSRSVPREAVPFHCQDLHS